MNKFVFVPVCVFGLWDFYETLFLQCMDFGFHSSIARALLTHVSAQECVRRSLQGGIDDLNKTITNLDSRLDKQRFLKHNNAAFMLPKKFEFQGHKGDEVRERERVSQSEKRLEMSVRMRE